MCHIWHTNDVQIISVSNIHSNTIWKKINKYNSSIVLASNYRVTTEKNYIKTSIQFIVHGLWNITSPNYIH